MLRGVLAGMTGLVQLPKKLDMLWSFVKSHLKSKCVVFLSSCKQVDNITIACTPNAPFPTNPSPSFTEQVKFIFEAFSRMRPGVVLMALHGKVKQMKRIQVTQRPARAATCFDSLQLFYDFCKRDSAVLFATDVAARSSAFPAKNFRLTSSRSPGVLISHPLTGWSNSTAQTPPPPTYTAPGVRSSRAFSCFNLLRHAHAQARRGTRRRARRCSCLRRLRRRLPRCMHRCSVSQI